MSKLLLLASYNHNIFHIFQNDGEPPVPQYLREGRKDQPNPRCRIADVCWGYCGVRRQQRPVSLDYWRGLCVSLALLCAGDVKVNPGPAAGKYQCVVCGKVVRNNHLGIECSGSSQNFNSQNIKFSKCQLPKCQLLKNYILTKCTVFKLFHNLSDCSTNRKF